MPHGPTMPMIDGIWASVIIPAKSAQGSNTGTTANSDSSASTEKTSMAELVPDKIGPVNATYDPELAAIFNSEL